MAITAKELVTSLRDRQTAIYTLVLPICLYPVVFWFMVQGFLVVQGQRERTEVTLRVAEARAVETIRNETIRTGTSYTGEFLNELEDELGGTPATLDAPAVEVVDVDPYPEAASPDEARAWVDRAAEPGGEDDPFDAALLLGARDDGGATVARLYYDSTRSRSEIARGRVAGRLPEFATRLRTRAARDAGVDPAELDPVAVERVSVSPARDTGALILSSLLPLLLVIMCVMGAFFPAVDLTAGEKERRTAETTMLLPVARGTVHQAKILAVAVTAVIATFLNLLALGLSAEHLLGMLTQAGEFQVELPVLALVAITPLALLFAFFTSAVLTGVAGLAATFKEGQALLGPVQMVFILPSMIGVMPGLELNLTWAFVPVVNVVLAFRAMLVGKELYLEYAVTAAALVVYAAIAIRLAVHLLSRESVALAGTSLPFRRLLTLLRGSGETR